MYLIRKVKLSVVLLSCVILVVFIGFAYAQEDDSKAQNEKKTVISDIIGKGLFSAGITASHFLPRQSSERINILGAEISYNANPKISLHFWGGPKTPGFELDELKESGENNKEVSLGKIEMTPYLMSVKYRIVESLVSLHLYGGAGYYTYNYDVSKVEQLGREIMSEVEAEYPLAEITNWAKGKIDNSIGYHVGINADISLTKNIFIFSDVKHLWITAKASTEIGARGTYLGFKIGPFTDTLEETLKLNSIIITIGLKGLF